MQVKNVLKTAYRSRKLSKNKQSAPQSARVMASSTRIRELVEILCLSLESKPHNFTPQKLAESVGKSQAPIQCS